jgi:Spy/CpxP family protein refolding chaperone
MKLPLVAISLAAMTYSAAAEPSPYAGMEGRTIKAMPEARIADIMAGKGAGYALTAELNGYPGPRHVLDLAEELSLSPGQKRRVQTLFDGMQREARALGGELIAREAELESLFAEERIDEPKLRNSVTDIAEIEGKLRMTHLKYHLSMKSLLTVEQVVAYVRLRGYGAARQGPGGHGGAGAGGHGGAGGGHGN